MASTISLFTLLTVAVQATQPQQSQSPCFNSDFASLNATGAVAVPGLQALNSYTDDKNSTWTLHTGLREHNSTASGTSSIVQSFWLDTTPTIDVPVNELPFTGCAILLRPKSFPARSSSTDQYGCDGFLEDACYDAILDAVNSNVTALLEGVNNPYNQTACEVLVTALPATMPECSSSKGLWGAVAASQPFGIPTFQGAYGGAPASCNASDFNVFRGSAARGAFIEIGSGQFSSDNQTMYDDMVDSTTPMIITLLPKDPQKFPNFQAESRLACLTPDNVTRGSLAVNGAKSLKVSCWTSAAVALFLAICGFMWLV